jgi:hypothetical protein
VPNLGFVGRIDFLAEIPARIDFVGTVPSPA